MARQTKNPLKVILEEKEWGEAVKGATYKSDSKSVDKEKNFLKKSMKCPFLKQVPVGETICGVFKGYYSYKCSVNGKSCRMRNCTNSDIVRIEK